MNKFRYKLKYPKLVLLVLTFVLAYFIFYERDFPAFHNFLSSLGYLGSFIAGLFFAYGFTAAPATAVLLILAKEQNILFAGIIAGLGALISDLIIFKFIRYSFADEFKKLSHEKLLRYAHGKIPNTFKKYLLAVMAGFIIASPLPDEIGVALLAAIKTISPKLFSLLSFLLNTMGILIILVIGKVV